MKITELPIAQFLGITDTTKSDALLEITYNNNLKNHLDLYHASAIYSLAEISSGKFLAQYFPDDVERAIPLVRRSTVKYSAIPRTKKLYSKGKFIKQSADELKNELHIKGQVNMNIQINIYDENDSLICRSLFEWFVTLNPEYLKVSKSLADLEK